MGLMHVKSIAGQKYSRWCGMGVAEGIASSGDIRVVGTVAKNYYLAKTVFALLQKHTTYLNTY